eukprot:gb/GFBE01011318.1/.p1 GENE.gb/GFBE01011318.1/~~gb/GFBE01011318.1/.p1  ORF type:complete len:689 (+),score=157.63 gb/GFBE01011318.1/:1-2067(+)
MPGVTRQGFFGGLSSSPEENSDNLAIKGRWGAPAARRSSLRSAASATSSSDSSDEERCSSIAKVSTHAGLSGAESASDDDSSLHSLGHQMFHWSSEGESESDGEGKSSETAESFCSALEIGDNLSDSDSLPSTPTGNDTKAHGCVFSVAMLLQLRAAMLCHYGPEWTAPATGTLSCQPCLSDAAASSSRAVERCQSGPVSSPTAWKPSRTQQGTVEDSNAKVTRAARALLNKLTVEKFDSLYEQLVTCGLRTPEHISILMREVFEKATAQHHFISMYADLCARLETDQRVAAALGSVEEAQRSSFKRLLLGQCQTSFEELLEPEPEQEAPRTTEEAEAAEEARLVKKQRKLGNVKLVGELLTRGMLHSQLLCTCIEDLLKSWDKCPEAIESLAALLTVAGAKFDVTEWPHRSQLQGLLQQISDLASSGKLPSRLRFLLKDVLELRAAGWQQRPKSGPMRITEVRGGSPCSTTASSSPASSSSTKSSPSFCLPSSVQQACSNQSRKPTTQPAPAVMPEDRQRALLRLSEICKAGNAALDEAEAGQSDVPSVSFDLAAFHKVLSATLRDLRVDRNSSAAVKKIRVENVPQQYQAREFTDLITRISEDSSGPSRRAAFAFLIGLCSTQDSAFSRQECIKGTTVFFREVYADLCDEVPRLSVIMTAELLPMLRKAWVGFDLNCILPQELHSK